MTNARLKSPFPYYGNKRRGAPEIWSRFGQVACYVEPFAGSLGCLLGRPGWRSGLRWRETANDADGHIVNVWRSIQRDPEAVWRACDHIVADVELTARHGQVIRTRVDLSERLRADPDWCDPYLAGVWVWGQSASIGREWGSAAPSQAKPYTRDCGGGQGVHAWSLADPLALLRALAQRLRYVRVLCGDWRRAVTRQEITATHGSGVVGVLLDPPYGHDVRDASLYATDSPDIAADVRAWAVEHASPRLRIALCGMRGEHEMPSGWQWWTGSLSLGQGGSGSGDEGIWFSPDCLGKQASLFECLDY